MILGIDYGGKRTGLALGDTVTKIATPMDTLTSTGEDLIGELLDLIEMEDITKVIVGLPLNENGEETMQSKKVEEFVKDLKSRVEVPVATVDEYLTTKAAAGVTRISGGDTDAVAAAMILDEYFSSGDGEFDNEEGEEAEA
ncbi:MAG: Holliday junction resolvase RuvX [bacterium]